jgi:transposase
MGDLSEFERGQVVGARLAGESVTKIDTLLGVSRATVSEVMSAYTDHGKTESAKRNSGQKSTLTERDHRTQRMIISKKSHDYRSTSDRTAELNIHLEDPISTKTVQRELHKFNICGRAVTTKLLITENNAQIRKRWCHDHKTWISDN